MNIVWVHHQIQRRLRPSFPAFLRLAFVLLLACILWAPAARAQPLKVVTSFSIIADLVKQVGGENVDVTPLVKPGSDAHMFEPTAQDARILAQADILFINGLGFEPWMQRLKHAAGFNGTEITVSENIAPLAFHEQAHDGKSESIHGHEQHAHHEHHELDPHAWQDVRNVVIYVQNIAVALAIADPSNAQHYTQRAQAYIAQLEALDRKIRESIESLPENHRILITTHDAFSYFGHAYGLTIIASMGTSSDEEPSAADIARLINQIRTVQAPAVFLENVMNPALMQQVTRETSAVLGGELYSDALSEPGTAADTYIGMMEHNLETLMQALSAH